MQTFLNNLSAEPFRLIKPAFASEVRELPPSQTWRAVLEQIGDVALISVARCSDTASVMEPLGQFGVGCFGAVGSVICVAHHELAQIARDRLPIHLTRESETSVLLFRYLWLREFDIAPTIVDDVNKAVARLCIGNEARTMQMNGKWPVMVDLGEWWFRRTGSPFVFARWMVRKSCGKQVKEHAHAWLEESDALSRTEEGRKKMIFRALEQRLFNTAAEATSYFTGLVSRFNSAAVQAETDFLELIRTAT